MTYFRTQRAPMYLVLIASSVVFLALATVLPVHPAARVTPVAVAVLVLFMACCFTTLTVRNEGAHLAVRFGPLPVFRKRIPYADMTDAKRSRSRFVDGWGIHYVAGRGWTYNLWGFEIAGRSQRPHFRDERLDYKAMWIGRNDSTVLP